MQQKRRTRVLLVDDEPAALTTLGSGLKRAELEIVTAASEDAALAVLDRGGVDVVLMDIARPSGAAMGVLDATIRRWPRVKVILLSSPSRLEAAREALRRGAYDCLVKPVDPQHVARVVRRAAALEALEDDHRRLAADNARQRAALARLSAERSAEAAGAREALAEEKERLELALDGARAGMWDLSLPDRTLVLSPRVYEILDVSPQSGAAEALVDGGLVHPEDLALLRQVYQAHADGSVDVLDIEHRVRVSGGWRWVRLRGHIVLRDAHRAPRRVVGTIVDINARRTAQEALRAHMERALVTLHSIADAVLTTDARGIVEQLNPVAEVLTGWSADEARGRALDEVLDIELPGPDSDSNPGVSELLGWCLHRGERITAADGTRLRSRGGRQYTVRCALAPIRDAAGQVQGAVLVVTDETERRRLARRLRHDATHDGLTGLSNRAEFERRLASVLQSREYDSGEGHAVFHLDLDQFKVVNDSVGHAAGDELLRQIGALLLDQLRLTDTVARFGGDEFSLLIAGCDVPHALEVAARINAAVRGHTFSWQGQTFELSASIGVVPLDASTSSVAEVMSRADVACNMAKELGRDRYHVYRLEDQAVMRRHGEIRAAADISAALQDGRFTLHAQPIVALRSDDLASHYEILVRMIDRQGALVQPIEFIPAAERFNLMGALDRWVIHEAFKAASPGGPLRGDTQIAINLSGASLSDPELLAYVRGELAASGVPHRRVCFEITETAVVSRMGQAKRFMNALRAEGVRFSLDDFGTGLSSLTYLKELPVDYLKIDGTFVRNVAHDPVDHAMISALNQLAATMGILTIAEYVESQEIADRLRSLGVDYVQGFHIGRPLPIAELGVQAGYGPPA